MPMSHGINIVTYAIDQMNLLSTTVVRVIYIFTNQVAVLGTTNLDLEVACLDALETALSQAKLTATHL